jgi:hypothetical protein
MKWTGILVVALGAGFLLSYCGSKDDSSADFYQSCQMSNVSGSTNLSYCDEYKNSTDAKDACEKEKGLYTQTQCTVDTGTKGCTYKNQANVQITSWYTGTSWTESEITTECVSLRKGSVITK